MGDNGGRKTGREGKSQTNFKETLAPHSAPQQQNRKLPFGQVSFSPRCEVWRIGGWCLLRGVAGAWGGNRFSRRIVR